MDFLLLYSLMCEALISSLKYSFLDVDLGMDTEYQLAWGQRCQDEADKRFTTECCGITEIFKMELL